jgi:hypothetical protein
MHKHGVIDVDALVAEVDRARADYEMKRKEIIEAALKQQEKREPAYSIVHYRRRELIAAALALIMFINI